MNATNKHTVDGNDPRRHELNQSAVDTWGTALILDRRARQLTRSIAIVGFIGFVIPLAVGLIFLNSDNPNSLFSIAKPWISWALIIQGVFSGASIFFGWQSKLKTYQDSSTQNKSLSDECRDLAINPSVDSDYMQQRSNELKGRVRSQSSHDERLDISPEERRRGGRAGLHKFKLKCRDCTKVPSSPNAKKDSSTCQSCGDF